MKDILTDVRKRLDARKGQLRQIADESGLSYDTVLRIKNEEGDPGYSKVFQLYSYLHKRDKISNVSMETQSAISNQSL